MGDSVKYPEQAPTAEGEGWVAVVNAVNHLRDEIDLRHVENTSVNEVQTRKLDEVIRRVDALHNGFPNGDVESHRRYHETLIAKAEARTAFYKDLRSDLTKKGLWAVVATVGIIAWHYMQTHLKIQY